MSKFNKVEKSNVETYEGGIAYKRDATSAWLNFLFSSYLEDTYYESSSRQLERFIELTNKVGEEQGSEFLAKAADFARNELGMRSVTHVICAMLNDQKFDNKRSYLKNLFYRPDDMCETFSLIEALGSKPSHAIVRAAGDELSSMSEYQLSKYGKKKRDQRYGLYDLINISHAWSPAIDKYKRGTLEAADTWENKISGARGAEENDAEWKRLVEEGKMGYLALIRNLRYIMNINSINASWISKYLVPQLTNVEKIVKSKVFPYQIYAAYRNMKNTNPAVICALDSAFRTAVLNIEELDGESCIMLDVSGSMDSSISKLSVVSMKEVGACFAAMLMLTTDCSFIKFGNVAKMGTYNMNNNIFEVINEMCANEMCGFGTCIDPAFELLENKQVDRIFVISDMQTMDGKSWGHRKSPQDLWNHYAPGAEVYSFDLANYSTQCFSTNPHFHFSTALNEKVFTFINFLENGVNLVDYINENY